MLATVLIPCFVFVSWSYGALNVENRGAARCYWPQFTCDDGTCLHFRRWCDSRADCEDSSDEKYCALVTDNDDDPNKCGSNFFKCRDGPCIPMEGKCDGFPSCRDSSDETDCHSSEVPEETTHLAMTSNSSISQVQKLNRSDFTEQNVSVTTQAYNTAQLSSDNYNFSSEFLPSPAAVNQEVQNGFNAFPHENHILSDNDYLVSLRKSKQNLDLELELPTSGFEEMDVKMVSDQRYKAEAWLLSRNDADDGWGEETSRVIAALALSDLPALRTQTEKGILMKKQLHLQLAVALTRNATTPVTLSELALYINALLATCGNPRNFHGTDLIEIFKQRVDAARNTGRFVSPVIYLTLCVSNATSSTDLKNLEEFHLSNNTNQNSISFHAMAALAEICTARMSKFEGIEIKYHSLRNLLRDIRNELPGNVYELALLAQALNEAHINNTFWKRDQALEMILRSQDANGSFGDILSTYYVLPVLAGRSLVSLGSRCSNFSVEAAPSSKTNRIYVQYSLYFGNPVEVSHTIQLKVANGSNFFNIMKLAAKADSIYEFRYDVSRAVPFVYSIGGVANDVERGLYWMLYISGRRDFSKDILELYNGDFRRLIPQPGYNLIFWRRTME
ncbi:uncharacterized protein CG3556-like [Stegodyphus dumicola]|uniref:uncharacterized protein CG3556-like n=1 Tax=Stegodyphus dumicola TaxID=202533 RepID=UPI0015B195DA|nr:uncharacterized protein CG3556-like [Stegodyphus dumicola]